MSTSSCSIRLALLLCDTPLPTVLAEHGTYHEIFSSLLTSSVPAGTSYSLKSFDVVKKLEYPPLNERWDGILLSGSAASAYENMEWINKLVAWVADVAQTRPEIKLFGICFGHQIIARALGGECVPNGGKWEVGITPVDLTDVGQALFGTPKLNIHQMHRDHVPTVPKPFLPLGSTSIAPNQGMVKLANLNVNSSDSGSSVAGVSSGKSFAPTDVQILTLQGHPEFTNSIVEKIVDAREGSGVLNAAVATDARQRSTSLPNDGVKIVGHVMWRILGVTA